MLIHFFVHLTLRKLHQVLSQLSVCACHGRCGSCGSLGIPLDNGAKVGPRHPPEPLLEGFRSFLFFCFVFFFLSMSLTLCFVAFLDGQGPPGVTMQGLPIQYGRSARETLLGYLRTILRE